MTKALFLDVDGTLISFETHEVPASALDALRRAHARGVRLFIATGRAAADLEPLQEIPYDGVVALNGADCLMRDGTLVARHPVPRADFEKALALSEELGFPVGLELNDGVFVNSVTPEVVRLAEMVAHPVPREVDLRALFDRGDCCQMFFYFDPELEKRVMPNCRRSWRRAGARSLRTSTSEVSIRRREWPNSQRISASRTTRRWLSATAATMRRCSGRRVSAWRWATPAARR